MTVVEEPDPMVYVKVVLLTLVVIASVIEATPVSTGVKVAGKGETTLEVAEEVQLLCLRG